MNKSKQVKNKTKLNKNKQTKSKQTNKQTNNNNKQQIILEILPQRTRCRAIAKTSIYQ